MTDVKRQVPDVNQRSRFDAFRESWFSLVTFIERLLEHQQFDSNLFEIIDRSFNAPWIESERISYAIAWRSVSSDAEESLLAPSMFGHHASSFHQLVAEMSLSLHEAVCIGILKARFGLDVTNQNVVLQHSRTSIKRSDVDWAALRYSAVHLAAQREVDRYRGWDLQRTAKRVKSFLDLEAAHVVSSQESKSRLDDSKQSMLDGVKFQVTAAIKNRLSKLVESTGGEMPQTPDDLPTTAESRNSTAHVTIKDIAKRVHLAARSMSRYTTDWPTPTVPHSGSRKAVWELHLLLPILREQFPNVDWDSF